MSFNQGKVVDKFSIKGRDGEKIQVIFRYPKNSDSTVHLLDSVRRETMYVSRTRPENRESEAAWLKKRIKQMEQGLVVLLFVEVEGKVVGNSEIRPLETDTSKHIADFGIILREKFTGIGIGTRLMRKVIELAKKETGYKIIQSIYFSKNKRSAALHKKLGFKEFGRLPKGILLKDGTYSDKVFVYKQIKKL